MDSRELVNGGVSCMAAFFEAIMLILLPCADFILLIRFAWNKSIYLWLDRLTAGTMGAGFALYFFCGIFAETFSWKYVFCLIGFFISYTGILFSIPEKGGDV